MSFLNLFKPNRKGYMYAEFVGCGLFNKDFEYKGNCEVEILEETNDKFKIKFIDFNNPPRFVNKEQVTEI